MFPVAIFPAIHWYLSEWPWSTSKCGDTADTPDSCQAGNVNSWAVDHWRAPLQDDRMTYHQIQASKIEYPQQTNGELINGDENMPKKNLPNSLHLWSKPTWRWTNQQHQAAHHQKNIWGPWTWPMPSQKNDNPRVPKSPSSAQFETHQLEHLETASITMDISAINPCHLA